jgi:hypothetical protein
MLIFGQVGSSWGHIAFFGSTWGEKVITPYYFEQIVSDLDVWGSIHTLKDTSRFSSLLFTIVHPVY